MSSVAQLPHYIHSSKKYLENTRKLIEIKINADAGASATATCLSR